MAKKGDAMDKTASKDNDLLNIMTDLLITQLAATGVQQRAIRQIVGCSGSRVSRITKHVKAARKSVESSESEA